MKIIILLKVINGEICKWNDYDYTWHSQTYARIHEYFESAYYQVVICKEVLHV